MYALLYIYYGSLSSATVRTPNPAFEHGRADKQRAFGKRQCRRAAQRKRWASSKNILRITPQTDQHRGIAE